MFPPLPTALAMLALLLSTALSASLPTVDLSYTLHRASHHSSFTSSYTFSNIRYAAPPLGALRFTAPAPPVHNRTLQTPDTGARQCPQAPPLWTRDPSPPPSGSEDCLFLDVVVGETVFAARGKGAGAPVLVWIHGGGFVVGNKAAGTPLEGLVKAAGGELIVVAMNYRLGAFGFLSGRALRGAGGTSNAGLLDQRAALAWVQTHIGAFGGDPARVTIIGESAGGGSVLTHIAAPGPRYFARAILQSPSLRPTIAADAAAGHYAAFLASTGCDDLACLRALDTRVLQDANRRATGDAPFGTYHWAPAVDGWYVPDFPPRRVSAAAPLRVMVGHNTNEKTSYANKSVTDFPAFVDGYFPFASEIVRTNFTRDLYPRAAYASTYDRLSAMLVESRIACTSDWLARAFEAQGSWNYQFAVAPATHGFDVGYTFWNGTDAELAASGKDARVVKHMQGYVANFAIRGDPNGDGLVRFPRHGSEEEARMVRLDVGGIGVIRDPTANGRCKWLEKGLWVPEPAAKTDVTAATTQPAPPFIAPPFIAPPPKLQLFQTPPTTSLPLTNTYHGFTLPHNRHTLLGPHAWHAMHAHAPHCVHRARAFLMLHVGQLTKRGRSGLTRVHFGLGSRTGSADIVRGGVVKGR
ncbi:carboxylesterase family protein-like protein, partial [Geopyxis carbonaria]